MVEAREVDELYVGAAGCGAAEVAGKAGSAHEETNDGSVLVLDEITTGLHTLLARRLVSLFHNKNLNKHGAQLVFTTHDTNLLAPGLLRRDEIWFAEKGRDGSTTIFPLTDIATKNTDNIERGYISGRFGGIPFVPDDGTSIHD